MKKFKRDKMILNISLCLITLIVFTIYTIFLKSYINKDSINPYTSFSWYSNIIIISVILTLPTIILAFLYRHYHKKIYHKPSSKIYANALRIFILGMILCMVDCFLGTIPFLVIASLFIAALVFFIIGLLNIIK